MIELTKYVNYIFVFLTIVLNLLKEAVINKVIAGIPVAGVNQLINYTFAYWLAWIITVLVLLAVGSAINTLLRGKDA